MKSPKEKPTGVKLRSWRVAIMRSRQSWDSAGGGRESGKDVAAQAFGLSEDQHKRLLILER
jgi:hypothetical protein